MAAVLSGWSTAGRVADTLHAEPPEGPVILAGRVADEPVAEGGNSRFVFSADFRLVSAEWKIAALPPLAVTGTRPARGLTAGDRVLVRGMLRAVPGRVRGDPVAGRIPDASLEFVSGSPNPLFKVGNALRSRVSRRLDERGESESTGLLRGFLIGDTSGIERRTAEDLRRAGLSHFVAVSGSNVALFLAGWWLVTAPIAARPRMRAAIGLVGLAIFVVVTRWEPSVVRAAVMAGLVLGGRVAGFPIDAWTALGVAVTGLVLFSGDLALNVGFQLSAVATAGVLLGAGAFAGKRPAWAWTALAATLSAQAAVTPLLLLHFGSVPLLSPIANMGAVPLVTASTVAGGLGVVLGSGAAIGGALFAADGVLWVARLASGWPQLGPAGAAAAAVAAALFRLRVLRPMLSVAVLAALAPLVAPVALPRGPTVTFLDVGQGDAILLRDDLGTVVLVDGGRDPLLLADGLRRHGVARVDLLIATHGDADHSGGLAGLVDDAGVGRIWVPDQPDLGDVLPGIVDAAIGRGIPVDPQRSGAVVRMGRFSIHVLGPHRRFKSPNDGSIVLWVEAAGRTLLLPADIEAVAQRELPPLRPDVLLVPHHGSATSDLEWLGRTAGGVAVISVGQNTYGHPAPLVVTALHDAGARTFTTLQAGDVSVAFG